MRRPRIPKLTRFDLIGIAVLFGVVACSVPKLPDQQKPAHPKVAELKARLLSPLNR